MIVNDLYAPLPARTLKARRRVPRSGIAALACLMLSGWAASAVMRDDGDRGDPVAVGSIGITPPAPAKQAEAGPPPAAALASSLPAPDAAPGTGQQMRIENGVMVIRGGAPGGSGPMTLKVADLVEARAAPRAADAQLIEATAAGPLPRIGRDGRRPSSVYAAAPTAAGGKPRIALLIGGMGLDRTATARASASLPQAVSFGFAPYGESLGEQVGLVRAAGHEVILQMPMEDFGRDGHAFPNMLKSEDAGNGTRMRWLMSRFTGYAGVANYLGGRLLADEASLKPLLQDVAGRGLFFVDDGTAPRSLALPLAHDLGLPALKADVVIDAPPADEASVGAAMLRLERIARERGSAFGTATGRPETNAIIGRYLSEAAKRGIVVVPLSQAVAGLGPLAASR